MPRILYSLVFTLVGSIFAFVPAASAAPSSEVLRASVMVVCDSRQGSGVLTNSQEGFVVTNGHVVLGQSGGPVPQDCEVGFTNDGSGQPKTYFTASVEKVVLDTNKDIDFAVLKIGQRIFGPNIALPAAIPVHEFAHQGDPITVFGFPSGGPMQQSTGMIKGWNRGIVATDAYITQGSSGSPAVDSQNRLIGIATRTQFTVDPLTGAQTITDYHLGDVLPLIAWLDTFGPNTHDRYLSHADSSLSHSLPYIVRDENPGCTHMVRTDVSPTVYCLLTSSRRLVFPNVQTYNSWFPDFTQVFYTSVEDISRYHLVGNVTFKAGSLIKIQSDPRVYFVADSIGTLREIPSEQRARELFDDNWATKVRDVPDSFFINYSFGPSL